MLGRLLESTDDDMRSVAGALTDAAPAFAKLRQAIVDGKIGAQYDLSRPLTEAIDTAGEVRRAVAEERGRVRRLIEEGNTAAKFDPERALSAVLGQRDMLRQRPEIVDAFVRAMFDQSGRLATRERIATMMMNYADRAMAQRLDQGMLFGDTPLPPERLLEIPREAAAPQALDLFGAKTPALDVARQVMAENPNIEIADATGQVGRARADLIAAQTDLANTEQRAPSALEAAANCFARRAGGVSNAQ